MVKMYYEIGRNRYRKYRSHSSRSDASSNAKSKGITLKDIAISTGRSSERTRTFPLHYD